MKIHKLSAVLLAADRLPLACLRDAHRAVAAAA